MQIPEVAVSRFFSGGGFSDYVRELGTPNRAILQAHIPFSSLALGIKKWLSANSLLCFRRELTMASTTRKPDLF